MNKKVNVCPQAKLVRETGIGWMLKTLAAGLDSQMIGELKPHGLNLNKFAMLMTLMEEEGLTQTEIGKKITMPGYATTRTLDALEASQLIERRTDEHSRRSYRIYLTKKGHGIGPTLFAIVAKVNDNLLSSVSKTQQQQLSTILSKLTMSSLA